ncbi:hypothetical protein GCM10019994_06110 [Enterococcus raffinosus]|nr:hypothetical protein RV13_GL002087 [Enterococcus raffinosus]GMS55613.1 hypothetical protein NUITMVRE36_26050 [Enterococcus raffinosus]
MAYFQDSDRLGNGKYILYNQVDLSNLSQSKEMTISSKYQIVKKVS